MIMNNKGFQRDYCFTFFGDWVDILKSIAKNHSPEEAFCCFCDIANYALYEEEPYEKSALINFWPMLERQIDASQAKKQRCFEAAQNKEM